MAEAQDDRDNSPGLVLLDDDGGVAGVNAAGRQWLEELGAGPRGDLPLELLAVVARLRTDEGTSAVSPRLRVRTRAGRWVVLHASWLGTPPWRRVAVIIERATPDEVLPVLLAAYGFTPQERRITGFVCRGLSTIEIAGRLRVTTNSVQDHLKSIFAKTGVRSRRELVALLLRRQYH